MPRKSRENAEGTIHHVWARGVLGAPIFLDDNDRHLYLRLLGEVSGRLEWECLAYCLMTNHVHLLVKTPHSDLGFGIQLTHGRYAQQFNFRHERQGHLFESRYGSTRIKDDRQLHAAAMYIAQNPVEAGLCVNPSDWPWSGYEAAMKACKGSGPGSGPLAVGGG